MPRLTQARKELRRAQIAEAAVRCFGRNGLERTSIADITAESGLSAGSIYTHYRNKAELVRAAARAVLARREAGLGACAAQEVPPDPEELLARMVAAINPEEARVGVQTWGEATTDAAVREIVTEMTGRLRALLHECVTAWLTRAEGREPAVARRLAEPIAHRLMARYLAELLYAALESPAPPAPPAIEDTP